MALKGLAKEFREMEDRLCKELDHTSYHTRVKDEGLVELKVANPNDDASALHNEYLKKYCRGGQDILILGMNPGPKGAGKTGVPFGNEQDVHEFLKLKGGDGLATTDVSGANMMEMLKLLCEHTPDGDIFSCLFVHNYCPLLFTNNGTNVALPALDIDGKKHMEAVCDKYLKEAVDKLKTKHIIAVGTYVNGRVVKLFPEDKVTHIDHPSKRGITPEQWLKDAIKKISEDKNLMQY